MLVNELVEVAGNAWGRKGSKLVRKYRCAFGVRKGRLMSSPAACNRPLDIHKSRSLKQTKQKKAGTIKYKSSLTKKANPASTRLKKLNKPKRHSRLKARRIK